MRFVETREGRATLWVVQGLLATHFAQSHATA